MPRHAEQQTVQPEVIEEAPKQLNTEEHIRQYFADVPIMIDVARCESQFRQFDEHGNVLRGVVNSKDVGAFQVNEKYHLETSHKLGLDIHTLEGNMAYARYLYDTQGTKPWVYSKPCWGGVREVVV